MNELDYLSVIAFTGKDADAFLHNQLTVNVRSLADGDVTFAALCEPKGRVKALLLLCAVDDGFRVICRRGLADGLVAHLSRFVFRDQVRMERLGDAVVIGDPAEDAPGVERIVNPLPGLAYGLGTQASVRDADGAEAFRARELAAGVAWLDEETTEQFLPQMLGHEVIGALDFRKGCFPGQEIIARTRYLGKLKRHPWSGRLDGKLDVGAMEKLTLVGDGASADGVLVDQAPLGRGAWQAFVVARRAEAFEVESAAAGDTHIEAEGRWLNEGLEVRTPR